MAIFLQDSFTNPAGSGSEALAVHVPEVGGTWVQVTGTQTASIPFDQDRVRPAGTTAVYYNTASPGGRNYWVEAVVGRPVNSTGRAQIGARITATGASGNFTGYFFGVPATGSLWELLRVDAGVGTTLAQFSQTITPGTNYTIRLVVNEGAIECFIGGVSVIKYIDSNPITANGAAGLRGDANGSIDTMVADNALAASFRLSQAVLEVPTNQGAKVRLSQTVMEVATAVPSPIQLSQVVMEVIGYGAPAPPGGAARPVVFVVI